MRARPRAWSLALSRSRSASLLPPVAPVRSGPAPCGAHRRAGPPPGGGGPRPRPPPPPRSPPPAGGVLARVGVGLFCGEKFFFFGGGGGRPRPPPALVFRSGDFSRC